MLGRCFGCLPLGYDSEDRKLVVVEKEAETVRHIFRRYVGLGCVRRLKDELDADGIVSKIRGVVRGKLTDLQSRYFVDYQAASCRHSAKAEERLILKISLL